MASYLFTGKLIVLILVLLHNPRYSNCQGKYNCTIFGKLRRYLLGHVQFVFLVYCISAYKSSLLSRMHDSYNVTLKWTCIMYRILHVLKADFQCCGFFLRTYAQYASKNKSTCSEHSVRIRRSSNSGCVGLYNCLYNCFSDLKCDVFVLNLSIYDTFMHIIYICIYARYEIIRRCFIRQMYCR